MGGKNAGVQLVSRPPADGSVSILKFGLDSAFVHMKLEVLHDEPSPFLMQIVPFTDERGSLFYVSKTSGQISFCAMQEEV